MRIRLLIALFTSLLLAGCSFSPPATPTPDRSRPPTLDDFWNGDAEFVLDVGDTGLPMGESDTVVAPNSEWWSFVHASDRSAGVVDRCGFPVEFPGCTVVYRSADAGESFTLSPPVCQFACQQCPCDRKIDHINQQQYPRVVFDGSTWFLVYEHGGFVHLRRSHDGETWSSSEEVGGTGIWHLWYDGCPRFARIGEHPHAPHDYDCLVGRPPGLFVEGNWLYIFVGLGQNPGGMGCISGPKQAHASSYRPCRWNPLFTGADEYGPLETNDSAANAHFDFRTVSSADVTQVGNRFYMLYEGVRGPGPGDPGDTQFGLGLARSATDEIDGPWERFPANPLLENLPGNIGLGHADIVTNDGRTFLYTSLDGAERVRLILAWKE
jgi:hypothetical protein